jgi:hypothetical protein
MGAKTNINTIPYADTLQRLMNASSGHAQMLADFFEGKSKGSVEQAAHALIHLVEKRTLSPESEIVVLQKLIDIAEQSAAVNRALKKRVFPAIVRDALEQHSPGDGRTVNHLNTLLRLSDGYGVRYCRTLIAEGITERVVRGWGHTLQKIQLLKWTEAFVPATSQWKALQIAIDTNIDEAFLGHAFLAGKKCEEEGEFGLAAGIFTALRLSTEKLIPLYEKARACNQLIRVDWLDYSLDFNHWGHLSPDEQEMSELNFKTVFGDELLSHPALRELSYYDLMRSKERSSIEVEGRIMILNDPLSEIVVEKILSYGYWVATYRFLQHPRSGYTLGCRGRTREALLIPAMQSAARREKGIGIAAALGQIALAHREIRDIAEVCATQEFDMRLKEVTERIYDAQGPWTTEYPPEYMGGTSQTPTHPEPEELVVQRKKLMEERSVRSAHIQASLVRFAQDLLNEAIERKLPLALDVFLLKLPSTV